MRLILIDNYSGYIFGEFCSSACLIDAARTVDADTGVYGRAYTVHDRAPGSTAAGYRVYRADVRGSEQVPAITDGADREMIDAVERDCEFMGFVEART